MSGRAASTDKRPGLYALSVGSTDMPAPSGWRWVRLLDVARLESGHTPSRKVCDYWDGEFPWIGIKDAREHHGGVIHRTLQTVTQAGLDNSAARLLPPKTVCLSRTASVGYTLIMGETMATSQDFVNWVCSDELAPEFLMYLFLAEKESLLRFGKGTTHTTIYYPEVKAFHVCLPSVDEQRSIVSALDSYFSRLDDAVANLERVQRNLKRYRASVLKAAVEGRLVPTEAELARAEGRDYEPAPVLLERILAERRRRWEEAELEKLLAKGKPPKNDKWKAKYKEPVKPDLDGLPELPEGWCWATVDQVSAQVEYGTSSKTSSDSSGVPVLRMGNIVAGVLDLSDLKFLPQDHDEFPRLILEDGDVVFNRTNSPELVGKSAVYRGVPARASFASYLIRVQLLSGLVPEYCAAVLNSPYGREWVARVRTQQVGQANVNGTKLKNLAVPLPPSVEQERACAALALYQSVLENVDEGAARSARRLHALRQSILARAFSGQLVGEALAEALVGAEGT